MVKTHANMSHAFNDVVERSLAQILGALCAFLAQKFQAFAQSRSPPTTMTLSRLLCLSLLAACVADDSCCELVQWHSVGGSSHRVLTSAGTALYAKAKSILAA